MVRITPLLDRSSRAGDGRPRARPSLARGAARRQGQRRPSDPVRRRRRRGPPSAARSASASEPTTTTSTPGQRRRPAGCGPGHDRPREPEPCGLAQPPVEAADRAQLAQQPDLADRDRAVDRAGRSRSDEASASASGRSSPGSLDRQPAGEVRVHVVAGQADARPAGRARRPAARAGWGRCPRRSGAATGRRSARRAPGPRPAAAASPRAPGATTLPGAGASWSARNARAGSATSTSPRSAISNTPTSSVDP